MGLYSGVTGKISTKIGSAGAAKDLLHCSDWEVSLTKAMIEASSFGDTYKEKVTSMKDWSAKISGSTDFSADSGQEALFDAFESGEKIEGAFYLDSDTFIKGDCYVTDLNITHSAEGKSEISISLAGSGAPTKTVPTL